MGLFLTLEYLKLRGGRVQVDTKTADTTTEKGKSLRLTFDKNDKINEGYIDMGIFGYVYAKDSVNIPEDHTLLYCSFNEIFVDHFYTGVEEELSGPQGNVDQSDKHRHFNKGADHRGQCLSGIDAERAYGNGDGQFKVVAGGGEGYGRCL